MVDLAKRKRFPSTTARFCTEELKIYPMVDFILTLEDHVIVVDGIRADESEKDLKCSLSAGTSNITLNRTKLTQ